MRSILRAQPWNRTIALSLICCDLPITHAFILIAHFRRPITLQRPNSQLFIIHVESRFCEFRWTLTFWRIHVWVISLAWMTTSWEGKSRWPGVVLGKIKSLWSSSQGTANDGLNQLIGASTKVQGRISFSLHCVDFRLFQEILGMRTPFFSPFCFRCCFFRQSELTAFKNCNRDWTIFRW